MSEEALTIGSAPRRLEARLGRPDGPPRAGAVVCHPHPQYGGDMHNTVVVAVGRAMVAGGIAALRFNFGGVGRSEGAYGGGVEEVGDARAALEALAARLRPDVPVVLVGYSFGASVALRTAAGRPDVRRVIAVAPPLDMVDEGRLITDLAQPVDIIVGDRDQFCDSVRLQRALETAADRVSLTIIPGADHFLAGYEEEVGRIAAAAVASR